MKRRVYTGELWLTVQGWPYQVSSRGHIRRKRSRKLINPWWDTDGYGTVQLKVGKRCTEFHLDSLVAASFSGQRVNGVRPLHLNGSPWDNAPINLGWGIGTQPYDNMTNLVTNWTVWHDARMQHGPFTERRAAQVAAQRVGDIIIGRNTRREIVAMELAWSTDPGKSPISPHDLVRKYRALATQHSNQFWSLELMEAAEVITALADHAVLSIIETAAPRGLPEPVEAPVAPTTRPRLPRRVAPLPAPAKGGLPRRPLATRP